MIDCKIIFFKYGQLLNINNIYGIELISIRDYLWKTFLINFEEEIEVNNDFPFGIIRKLDIDNNYRIELNKKIKIFPKQDGLNLFTNIEILFERMEVDNDFIDRFKIINFTYEKTIKINYEDYEIGNSNINNSNINNLNINNSNCLTEKYINITNFYKRKNSFCENENENKKICFEK